jgi:LmbE family N-acetylglucosaminyl deacetylase
MSDVLVVSPHLDDAVLSASARLYQPDTRVVSVFAGPPPEGVTERGSWDRLTGATGPHERLADRHIEDDKAMDILGVPRTRLSFVDNEYQQRKYAIAEVAEALAPHIAGATEVWIPSAVGSHPDHVATREGALAAVRAAVAKGATPAVRIFADQPYSLMYGWPSWVTGVPEDPMLQVSVWLRDELVDAGLPVEVMEPVIHHLTPSEQDVKKAAMAAYVSQMPALETGSGFRLTNPEVIRYEVSWRLPLEALAT